MILSRKMLKSACKLVSIKFWWCHLYSDADVYAPFFVLYFLMLNFITTLTNVNDKLYNKTIVDYLGTGYGVDIHHWISTIASVSIGKWWISHHIREYKPSLFLNEMRSLQTLPQFLILFHFTMLRTLHLRKPRNRFMKYHSIIAYQEIACMISPHC